MPWSTHQNHREHYQLTGYYRQQLDPMAQGYTPCLRAITATAFLDKATENLLWDPLQQFFVPHAVEALLNSQHSQHFSVSHLIPMKSS